MTSLAIVDAGPLYAAADADDRDHESCVAALSQEGLQLVVPAMVIAEATYFAGRRLGDPAESAFLAGIAQLDVEAPTSEDLARMAELVDRYADFPLGGTDASVIALAERLQARVIITLDRRHFAAITPRHMPAFELRP
jgi:predicted nucleic acid-binding protein